MRPDGRRPEELRPVVFELGYLKFACGSCLAKAADTTVLAACSFEPKAPAWLSDKGKGWIIAEYSMLQASTPQRSQEISRLAGRSLRMGFEPAALGESTVIVDCDVIQADGGTRTLSVCAGFMALYQASEKLRQEGILQRSLMKRSLRGTRV